MAQYKVVLTVDCAQGASALRHGLYKGELLGNSINVVSIEAIQDHTGRRWVGAQCKLDGWPASISGRMEPFATVRTFQHGRVTPSMLVEYAWETVERVMTEGKGEFHS